MAQPSSTAVHQDQILTNISVAYIQGASDFIATKVFPVVRVAKKSDEYYTYTKADWFRDEAALRGEGAESAGSGYGQGTASYTCQVYALHKDVPDQVVANADSPLAPARDATLFVTQRLLLKQEITWVTDAFAASIWDTSATPGTTWDDYTASDPLGDIETGKRTILINTGYLPNKFAMGYDVWIKLKNHPDIVDRIKYTAGNANPAVVTEQAVAALIGVEEVLVAKAIKNTAVEGETASYSFTHGKHALLTYTPSAPSILTPSAGYTFVWNDASMGFGQDVGINRFRMPALASERVEGQMAWDNKIVATDLGYFFNGAVA